MTGAPDPVRRLYASATCRSCGLCCDGTLNLAGDLRPEEVAGARGCGLDVCDAIAPPVFRLPCPQLVNQTCAVYEAPDRPQTCRGYSCWVVERYLNGRLTLRSAEKLVGMAIALRRAVAARIGPKRAIGMIRLAKAVAPLKDGRVDYESGDVWGRFERRLADAPGALDESGRVSAELIGKVLRTGAFLRRHFVWPDHALQKTVRSAPPDRVKDA